MPKNTQWSVVALYLLIGTLIYNLIEAVIALWAGLEAGSDALVGFGLDSVIEFAASVIVLWRIRLEISGAESEEIEKAEQRVHRFVGITFFALAIYIAIDASKSLILNTPPSESLIGIVLAIASLIIMPVLAFYKIKAARALNSRSLEAEAKETLACSYLSFTLLLGLSLNAWNPGLWWADPVAALLMIPWLIREGKEAFEGDED